ncbi:MAG: His/Gly/Thr/Pro-type tRNA ligase C-terminal domain-containing protein [Promethearchaeota archaeon]
MKKPVELQQISRKIYEDLIENDISAIYDSAGSIGKRYRRTEEIGVRYAFTIDHQSMEDNTVTIRNIEDMSQKRVKIDELIQLATNLLHNKTTFEDISEI